MTANITREIDLRYDDGEAKNPESEDEDTSREPGLLAREDIMEVPKWSLLDRRQEGRNLMGLRGFWSLDPGPKALRPDS